jgi:CO/xanthine dehydrogenase FAD-binding subunit
MAEYLRPNSLEEAAGMIAEHGSSLVIVAGGTSALRFAVPYAEQVMGVRGLGMNKIERSSAGLSLGAGVTMSQIRDDLPIPALREAARGVGGPAMQNMATIGGNIFAHQPYGDVAVVLLALDATVTFLTTEGEKTQKLEEFYNSGAKADGLLTRIDCAAPGGELVFLKCGRRRVNARTVISVAACIGLDNGKVGNACIAVGGAAQHPMRCTSAEQALIGQALDDASIAAAGDEAARASSPGTDAVASEWYRRRMVAVYLKRALQQIMVG